MNCAIYRCVPTRQFSRLMANTQRRSFAVQQLPWCAPKHDRGNDEKRIYENGVEKEDNIKPTLTGSTIDRFGVVAAMSKNGIIGIDGGIPWKAPEDRKIFKSLTNDSILIIGRRTFEEHPNLVHVDHTKFCIVVSRSMKHEDVNHHLSLERGLEVLIVKSLEEGLQLAQRLNEEHYPDENDEGLVCWVAGGERMYFEALRHKAADEIHLSVVDLDIDLKEAKELARFPAKYRWDNKFSETSRTTFPSKNQSENPSFTYITYKRNKRGSVVGIDD